MRGGAVMADSAEKVRTAGIVVIACVAVVAALFFGREFFVPLALAVLLDVTFRPVIRVLQRLRVPAPLASAAVVPGAVGVLLLLYLLLASGDRFREKLLKVIPRREDRRISLEVVNEVESVVLRYLLVTAAINLGQAVLVGLVLWALDMPDPLLWAVFTFILEFIPYLGAVAMIGGLTIMAFVTFEGLGHALLVPGSYLVITALQN